jgi:hypothetical protein
MLADSNAVGPQGAGALVWAPSGDSVGSKCQADYSVTDAGITGIDAQSIGSLDTALVSTLFGTGEVQEDMWGVGR